MQVAQDGDPALQTRAYELLAECRRSLYRLLADDDTTHRGVATIGSRAVEGTGGVRML